MKTLSIEDERNKDGKGEFRAAMLGYIRADMLWKGDDSDQQHCDSIYVTLGGKEAALRAVPAQHAQGRKVHILEEGRYRTSR